MEKENLKEIYLAGGCFWGTEHYFKQIDGVVDTEVGFANGRTENPTYKEVCTDKRPALLRPSMSRTIPTRCR